MIRTNLSERLIEGRQLARKKHRDQDLLKLGNLRAGNSGMMSPGGEVVGSCHRIAHLRSLGIELDPPPDSRLIMFQVGTANEDLVAADLKHTCAPNEVVLREEEIPIEWMTGNGTKVTGRPDMVVCQLSEIVPTISGIVSTARPVFGVEIKSIASVWTSRDVLGERMPKMEHLIQAAHYSWKLGVPFRLLYKQYAIQEIPGWKGTGGAPGWGQKLFPRRGEPGSEHIDYEMGRIQPFEIVYELEWAPKPAKVPSKPAEDVKVGSEAPGLGPTGRLLRFRQEGTRKWTLSLVSDSDIERFYEFVSKMATTENLGPRPSNVNPEGKEKNWSRCDSKYCVLSETCTLHEDFGYRKWLEAVKAKLQVD